MKEDQEASTSRDGDRKVNWRGGDGVEGSCRASSPPAGQGLNPASKWVPQASDVFKQRRNTEARVAWGLHRFPLAAEWGAELEGEEGKQGAEATLHTCTTSHCQCSLSAICFPTSLFFNLILFNSINQCIAYYYFQG